MPERPTAANRRNFQPVYLELWQFGELARRVKLGLEKLADCVLCPRNCHVNRIENKTKVCRTGRCAIVSSHFAHFGEEQRLRGNRGSGTIFFSWCNLRCVFCQNCEISWLGGGRPAARSAAEVKHDFNALATAPFAYSLKFRGLAQLLNCS